MDTWVIYATNGSVIGLTLALFIGYLRWEAAEARRMDERLKPYEKEQPPR